MLLYILTHSSSSSSACSHSRRLRRTKLLLPPPPRRFMSSGSRPPIFSTQSGFLRRPSTMMSCRSPTKGLASCCAHTHSRVVARAGANVRVVACSAQHAQACGSCFRTCRSLSRVPGRVRSRQARAGVWASGSTRRRADACMGPGTGPQQTPPLPGCPHLPKPGRLPPGDPGEAPARARLAGRAAYRSGRAGAARAASSAGQPPGVQSAALGAWTAGRAGARLAAPQSARSRPRARRGAAAAPSGPGRAIPPGSRWAAARAPCVDAASTLAGGAAQRQGSHPPPGGGERACRAAPPTPARPRVRCPRRTPCTPRTLLVVLVEAGSRRGHSPRRERSSSALLVREPRPERLQTSHGEPSSSPPPSPPPPPPPPSALSSPAPPSPTAAAAGCIEDEDQ